MSAAALTGNRCECAMCGKRFTGLTAFDDHRVWLDDDKRGCLTTEQLADTRKVMQATRCTHPDKRREEIDA